MENGPFEGGNNQKKARCFGEERGSKGSREPVKQKKGGDPGSTNRTPTGGPQGGQQWVKGKVYWRGTTTDGKMGGGMPAEARGSKNPTKKAGVGG